MDPASDGGALFAPPGGQDQLPNLLQRFGDILPELQTKFNQRLRTQAPLASDPDDDLAAGLLGHSGCLSALLDLGVPDQAALGALREAMNKSTLPYGGLSFGAFIGAYAAAMDGVDPAQAGPVTHIPAEQVPTKPSVDQLLGVDHVPRNPEDLRSTFSRYAAPSNPDHITYLSLRTALENDARAGSRGPVDE